MRWRIWGAIVAAAVLAAPAVAQQQQQSEAARGTVLNVAASGMTTSRPDMATIHAGVTTQSETAQQALAENSRRMQALIQTLRRSGVAERDIQTSWVRVNQRYEGGGENQPPRVVGYEATNTVSAKIRAIDNTGRIIDAVVASGGNQIHGVAFGMQDVEAQVDAARRDAIRIARQRAQLYADGLGMRVVRLISVSEAGAVAASYADDQIIVTGSRASGGMPPPPPIAPGELETRAQLSVSFELR